MMQSLNILFKANPREVARHLPIPLGRIQKIAATCTAEALNVVSKYQKVIDTLHEIQIASLAKEGKTVEAKKLAESEAEQKKMEKHSLDLMLDKIDKDYQAVQVKEESKLYKG